MTAEVLLSRLDGVKRTGVDRWIARCPSHDDKRPSLGIKEGDGDRVLVKCWAGCSVEEVLAAVGLTFPALYPARPTHRGRPEKRPWPAADVLRAVGSEATIVAVAASTVANGGELTEADRQRAHLAASRLIAAVVESGHD
jgi:hypothetical protein